MKREKGIHGENIAVKYLQSKGYEILARNWSCHWGELDLVAQKNSKTVVFIEVKFRTSTAFGNAHDALTYYKFRHLYRTIQFFLAQQSKPVEAWRLDAICITQKGHKVTLSHYKNICL